MAQYEDDIAYWREAAVPQFAVSKEMCVAPSWLLEQDKGKLQFVLLYGGDILYPGYMIMVISNGQIVRTGVITKREHIADDRWRFYVDLPPLDNKDA